MVQHTRARAITEHSDPIGKRYYVAVQHLERYRFAMRVLQPGQRVLDIACGAGYGSAMLTQRGCQVVGADYDPAGPDYALRTYGNPNQVVADALDLGLADESFDAVVTFETIEHVTDGHRFLAEMRRVLRPGGLLICSTPNIQLTRHPIYHRKEYHPDEFYALVEGQFADVERYAQYITPADRRRDHVRWAFWDTLNFITVNTGTRNGLRDLYRALRRRLGKPVVAEVRQAPQDRIRRAIEGPLRPGYEVRPLGSPDWIRIMLVVARK